MRKFKDIESAILHARAVIDRANKTSIGAIAEQIYTDSDEFTYRDKGKMYESGEDHSRFEDGVIIERKPYVRRRYYEGGTPGANNRNAQPRWFEKSFAKNKDKYKEQFNKAFEKAKKEL